MRAAQDAAGRAFEKAAEAANRLANASVPCPKCGATVASNGPMQTLVGSWPFTDAEGKIHWHDPNCRTYTFACECGWGIEREAPTVCPTCGDCHWHKEWGERGTQTTREKPLTEDYVREHLAWVKKMREWRPPPGPQTAIIVGPTITIPMCVQTDKDGNK